MEKEITFIEAIQIIEKDNGEFKVVYEDRTIEFIDKYDGLDGLTFDKLFKAKFYTNYNI